MGELADRFARLETIARGANAFVLGAGEKYTGPIRPAGIIRQTSNDSRPIPKRKDGGLSQDYFVLADKVSLKFTLGDAVDGSEPYPTGIVLAPLNDNGDFSDWYPQTKTLGSLQAIFWCSDGSIESACAESSGARFRWEVLFKREHEQPRTERRSVEPFDADEYRKGGWRTAVEKQLTHYERLGLDAHEHITAAKVAAAHRARANWWRQRGAQAHGGKNNPLIAELIPFIKTAEENLQQALTLLSDVDRKAAYDRQLELAGARATEEKFREFVDFTLRDKVLTSMEKNDLLDQARDLGIRRDRAEELVQQALRETGSMEGQPSSVPVVARSEVSVPVAGTDSPQLIVNQTSFSLGVLTRGDRRHCIFSVDNRGGGVLSGSIHSSHPEWLIVSQPEIDVRRHHQDIGFTVDTSKLDLGLHYVGAIAINSNGGRESVRVECSIELQSALLSRWRKQVFWAGIPLGVILGLVIYHLMPSPLAYAVTQVAGLVGAIALVVVCAVAGKWGGGIGGFFLASIVQTAFMRTTVVGYSAIAWAEIASAFLFFWAKPLLTARLAGNARIKVWAAASGSLVAAMIISAGVAVEHNIPQPLNLKSTTLPVEDKFAGNTIGAATGIRWTNAIGNQGAVFSAADSSRIEYPGLIPAQGTLEFWIKVNDGYHYDNYRFMSNQNDAMIFSSDVQGGDVTWPGTTKISVTHDGGLSLWMATVKGVNQVSATEARKTSFRFGEWHAIGVSYGSYGQYVMLDGKIVASSPGRTQTFGWAGNQQSPLDVPTIGETVSHFWQHHRYEGGFDGEVAGFRVSGTQRDWVLAKGVNVENAAYSQGMSPKQIASNQEGGTVAVTPTPGSDNLATTAPSISSISTVLPQQLQNITIIGSGFGTRTAYNGDSDYIRVSNLSKRWNAGSTKDPGTDKVTLYIALWTDERIEIGGFAGSFGTEQNFIGPGDEISFQVWNPQTGLGPASFTVVASASISKAGSSELAITGMISQWAVAHTANDVASELAFYAPVVDQYYNHHDVPREFVQQSLQNLLNRGVRLSRYEASDVTVTMNNDSEATVDLEKLWSTRPGGSMPNHTRSQLRVRSMDGKWLITGERDF